MEDESYPLLGEVPSRQGASTAGSVLERPMCQQFGQRRTLEDNSTPIETTPAAVQHPSVQGASSD